MSLEPFAVHPCGGRTTLYLVRHGRTQGNLERLLHGATDLPLDRLGLRQSQRVAERLAENHPADTLVTSPLQRARTTAEIIGARLGLVPKVVPGLVEMNFGDLEGVSFDELVAKHPELAQRALDLNDWDLAWPNGESRREFHIRVRRTFEEILTAYPAHRVIVVAHGGVLGSFLAQVEGRSPNDWRTYSLLNCSLTHVDVTPERVHIHLFNDCLHLDTLNEADEGDA